MKERILSGTPVKEDESFINILRPKTLDEFIGQEEIKERIRISIEAAKIRKEPLEHVLLFGPPGLGKTTLAHIIANELNSKIITASGPNIEKAADLMGILTHLEKGQVFFIDEIHRLPVQVEEYLYPAIEDFKVDLILGKGSASDVLTFNLNRFTLIGATTRAGNISNALRERFGFHYHLDYYRLNEMERIVERSARILGLELENSAIEHIAKTSRYTPRIANRILKRIRDYALVKNVKVITKEFCIEVLNLEGIDENGLDELDRKYLKTIVEKYSGGPVGIDTISASINEDPLTIEDVIEPYLIMMGLINRTPKGRIITKTGLELFGIKRELF